MSLFRCIIILRNFGFTRPEGSSKKHLSQTRILRFFVEEANGCHRIFPNQPLCSLAGRKGGERDTDSSI